MTKASSTESATSVGYMYKANGCYAAQGMSRAFLGREGKYRTGDLITVLLDLDASTVAFRKSGKDVVSGTIAHEVGGYYFAFDTDSQEHAVTIVEMK